MGFGRTEKGKHEHEGLGKAWRHAHVVGWVGGWPFIAWDPSNYIIRDRFSSTSMLSH